MTIRELLVKIGARVDGFDKGLDTAERALDRWGDRLQRTGTKLSIGLTAPITAAAFAATKASIDFESAFKNVEKTVDAPVEAFAELKTGIRGMSQEIPIAATELANIAAIGGQFGVSTAGLLGFTRTVADLGVAIDGISAEQAAAEMAQIAKVTGTAEGEFRNMGSALVELGNKGNSTEGAILEFTQRLAGAGHLVGLTAPQIMGIGASMANLGLNAEAGGTAMSKVMSKIEAAVARGGSAVASFAQVAGMSAQAFSDAFRNDPIKAIEAFIDGLGRQKDAGKSLTLVLDDLEMKDTRLTDTLKRLAQSGGEMTKQVDLSTAAWHANAALTDEASKKYSSTENQLKLLKNQLKDAAITVGDVFAKRITDSSGSIHGFIVGLQDTANAFAGLNPRIQDAVIYTGGFLALIGPATFALGTVVKGLSGLVSVFGIAATTIAGVVGWLGSFQVAILAGEGALIGIGAKAIFVSESIGLLTLGLGWAAAAVGTFIGAWKLGGIIGEVTGLTDWIGKKLAGALYGVTPAQYEASRAAQKHADALKNQSGALQTTTGHGVNLMATLTPLKTAVDQNSIGFDRLGRSVSTAGAEAGEASEEFKKLFASLSGQDALAQATLWAQAITKIGGATKLTTDMQERARGVLQDLIDSYDALGKNVPPKLQALYDQLSKMPDLKLRIETNKEDARAEVERLHGSLQQWLQSRPLQLLLKADPNGVNLNATLEPFKKAVQSNLAKPGLFDNMMSNLGDTIRTQLGPTILQAFQGGGDVGKSIGGLLGGSIGETLGKKLGDKIGGTLGGVLGSVIPGLGTLLGGLAGSGISKLFGRLFGGDNKEKERLAAEAKKNEAALQSLTTALKGANTELGNLISKATGLGVLPQPLKDALQHLIAIGAVTPDVAAQFGLLANQTSVDFEKMQSVAETYGVDLASLGTQFQSARLHQSAEQIINDFDVLTRGGADVGGVLLGMSDEISALVVDSLKFGTDIPANMQPWITELLRAGLLTDENGQKITDVSALKFGDPIKTQWETITTALQAAADKLGEIAASIAGIPNQKVITIRAQYDDPGAPLGFGDPRNREDWGSDIPRFATGTLGVTGSYFANFGSGTLAQLDRYEAVVTPQQAPSFAAEVLGLDHATSGRGPSPRDMQPARDPAMLAALGELSTALRRLPKDVSYAAVEASALRGRKS